MTFSLEALQANDGDCLLLHYGEDGKELILIDGGSSNIYKDVLEPRLMELRGDADAIELRLVMVSHIDADHITGILNMFAELVKMQENGQDQPIVIRSLWHNSFKKLMGGRTAAVVESGIVGAAVNGAISAGVDTLLDQPVHAVVASVKQGNDLRNYATQLTVKNREFGDALIVAPEQGRKLIDMGHGLTFTLLGPHQTELDRLEESWKKAKLKSKATPESIAADYLNRTIPNLSSVVVLAEMKDTTGGSKRMLLTGDAGGDMILTGLESAGLLQDGKIHLDLLKVQHHGSNHSITQDFLENVTADHYVISGNGKHGIPHPDMLQWLSDARKDEPYDAYLTNREGVLDLTEHLDKFLADEASQPTHKYHFRIPEELSIRVDLS